MSIATELEALNTNLTAAKAAVTAKGGTVGDTGLAGLATEIANIPSGSDIPAYGILEYYTDVSEVIDANFMGCTGSVVDQELLSSYYNEHEADDTLYFRYDSENSVWLNNSWEEVGADLSAAGISVSDVDEWAEVYCNKQIVVDKTGGTDTVDITTQAMFNEFTSYDTYYDFDGTSVYSGAVKEFTFGPSTTSLPNGFHFSTVMEKINYDYATGITAIGDNVQMRADSDNTMYLPNLTTIGNTVFIGSSSVNFPELLTIGNSVNFIRAKQILFPKVTTIGKLFQAQMASYIGLASLTSIGNEAFLPQAIWIYMPLVETIGYGFCYNSKVNQLAIDISSVRTIGLRFLDNCTSLKSINKAGETPGATSGNALLLPATIESIGSNFMRYAYDFTGNIAVSCPVSVLETGTDYACLSAVTYVSTSPKDYVYTKGFTFSGAQASSWKTRIGNLSGYSQLGQYFYRKVN